MSTESGGRLCLDITQKAVDQLVYICIFLLMLKYGNCSNFTRCSPAEEGTNHTIQFFINTTNTSLQFYVETTTLYIAKCSLKNLICSDEFQKKALSVLEEGIHDYQLNITIVNVNRASKFDINELWTLRAEQNDHWFMSCHLKIYAKASSVNCKSNIIATSLHVLCSTERIYPKATCLFRTNDTKMNDIISKLEVHYAHDNVTYKPVYYRSSCSIILTRNNATNGTHDVLVTIYPNVTGDDTDQIFGTNITHTIDLAQPGLTLKDCPTVIEIGESITCRCELSQSRHTYISRNWFDENDQTNLYASDILHFKATPDTNKYKCVGTGYLNATIFYRPSVYSRPFNFTCRKLRIDNTMISCNSLHVYPEPRCTFTVYDDMGFVKLQNDTTSHKQKKLSVCELNISESLLNKGFRVNVNMHPHITGNYTDLTLGADANITLDISNDIKDCRGEECHYTPYIISVIILAFILICLLVVSLYLYKKGVLKYVSNLCPRNVSDNSIETQRPSDRESYSDQPIDPRDNTTDSKAGNSACVDTPLIRSSVSAQEESARNIPEMAYYDKNTQVDITPESSKVFFRRTSPSHKTTGETDKRLDELENKHLINSNNDESVADYSKSNDEEDAHEKSNLLQTVTPPNTRL